MAVTASTTTGTRNAMERSWRPFTEKVSSFPVSRFMDCWPFGVEEVGLTATRNRISFPLLIPPTIPPAWFVCVFPFVSIMASLCSDPNMEAALNPVPNSIPRIAGMENTAWLISDSTELKKGSPKPGGIPLTVQVTIPPTLSLASIALCKPASTVCIPPNSEIKARTFSSG